MDRMKKLIFIALSLTTSMSLYAQQSIPLYEGPVPNSKPAVNEEKTEYKDGITLISKISIPTLSIYLPPAGKSSGTGVIICPGGGYWVNAFSHEGTDVAKKLNEMGVAAFVLKYRIPNPVTMINPEIGPLQDAQQAIKLVRQNAKEWKVNPERIGIMGFSAGGHLASTAGTHFDSAVIENPTGISLRPDFMVLIYPVISFADSLAHTGSRDQLIGQRPSVEKINFYSNERHVTQHTPATFLVHASDDDGVKSENSIVFYQSLIHYRVPAEMHLYQRGGHGFGLNNKTTTDHWMDRCKAWLLSNGWLK